MHPVVLAHGFFGFAEIVGIQYFKGVEDHLKNRFSGLRVVTTEVAPNDLVEDRAAQLWSQIERIGEKVHIVAHSMGGLDSRFMISPHGLDKSERVASLTTIATPHWGSPIADYILERYDQVSSEEVDRFAEKLSRLDRKARKIIKILKGTGEVWRYLLEFSRLGDGGLNHLKTSYLREFNQTYGDAPGVSYFSYGGVSGPGEKDPLPAHIFIPWALVLLSDIARAGGRNDGMVAVESAKWGHYKGEIPADHFKQVGHDLTGLGWLRKLLPWLHWFDHLEFFEQVVAELRDSENS